MRRVVRSAWLVGLLVAAAAPSCARRPKPVVYAPPPALEVPVVPERVVSALPEEPEMGPVPVEPEPKPAARPARPRPRPQTPTADAAQKTEPQPESGPPEPPKTTDAPAGGVLRTTQTADEPEAARRVRGALGRANGQLARVNVGALSRDARAQYDTARRFIDQAEGALVARNYLFAGYLADKAETLARGLVGR
jgi:hypothetical protein